MAEKQQDLGKSSGVEFPVENGPVIVLDVEEGNAKLLSWKTNLSAADFVNMLKIFLDFELREADGYIVISTFPSRNEGRLPLRLKPLIISLRELKKLELPPDIDQISAWADAETITWQKTTSQSDSIAMITERLTPGVVEIPFSTVYRLTTGVELPNKTVVEIMQHAAFKQK